VTAESSYVCTRRAFNEAVRPQTNGLRKVVA